MVGEVSAQGDVYSYDILLLELFTGKRPTSSMFTDNFNLRSYVKMALPRQVIEIVDQQMLLEEEEGLNNDRQASQGSMERIKEVLESILRIGVSCSDEMPKERMDTKDVLMELQRNRNSLL
ncbi:unnamed protein product [Ilex paraguariensis]|uniref:Uncharacterized protein n=1 Tax=Ilex paraguariensis TaxID=185542 RepID=A0ABC8TWJ2_9AQUA